MFIAPKLIHVSVARQVSNHFAYQRFLHELSPIVLMCLGSGAEIDMKSQLHE